MSKATELIERAKKRFEELGTPVKATVPRSMKNKE